MIPVYQPFITEATRRYAAEAIESSWIGPHGQYLERASAALRERFGYKHVLLTCNGTAAGHLVALALQDAFPSTARILVPNNVYVAAWNMLALVFGVERLCALRTDDKTWCLDTEHVCAVARRGDALLAVHNLGGVINVPAIRRRLPWLPVVEDNCEGLGGAYEGLNTGNGPVLAASLSFFANKSVTAGEGGAFVTSDSILFELAARTGNQGSTDRRFLHDRLGFNYRMTNVQAAILLGQIEALDEIRARKAAIWRAYEGAFAGCDRIETQHNAPSTANAQWMYGVRIHGLKSFDVADAFLHEQAIEVRPMFYPIHRHPHLSGALSFESETEAALSRECIVLPSYPALSPVDQERVIGAVLALAKE